MSGSVARWQSVDRILFLTFGGVLLMMLVVRVANQPPEAISNAPSATPVSAEPEGGAPREHPDATPVAPSISKGIQAGIGLAFLVGLAMLVMTVGQILRDATWRFPPPMLWHASLLDVAKLVVAVLALYQIVGILTHWISPDGASAVGAPSYWVAGGVLGYAGVILASKPVSSVAFGFDPKRLIPDGISSVKAYVVFIPILMGSMLLAHTIWQAWLAPDGSGPTPPQQVPVTTMTDPGVPLGERIFMMIYAVTGAAFVEEVFFRGFLYTALRKNLHWIGSVVVCGILFGVIHDSSFHAMPLAVFGMYLCILREFTGSLVVPIMVHGLHNGLQLLLMHLNQTGGGA